jgi:hypothetical protein
VPAIGWNYQYMMSYKKFLASIDLKSFLNKMYAMYHTSPKNARQLNSCAASLEMEILKIGRILSTRQVASNYKTVLAVWQDYEALELTHSWS